MELFANESLQHTLSEPTRLEKRINESRNHKLKALICPATSIFERKIQRFEHENEAAKYYSLVFVLKQRSNYAIIVSELSLPVFKSGHWCKTLQTRLSCTTSNERCFEGASLETAEIVKKTRITRKLLPSNNNIII